MCFSAQRTILARLLFSCTVGICYMQVFVMVTDPPLHLSWPIVLGAALILVEMCVALYRGKEDWKWFSPAVFLYLASTIPSVWLLEMTLHRERVQLRENATSQHQETIRVGELSLEVNGEDWVRALEQVIFLTLILGRWVMPRSALSRDQLSELLLVYVTAGADILELFSLLDEDNIKYKEIYIYPILGLFTLGMVQFPIMFTSFHDKPLPKLIKNNSVSPVEDSNEKSTNRLNNSCCGCCTKEVIGIFMTLLMQDGPFLALRLYFMIQERIFHNLMVFFVGKNFVVIVLQIYRLVSIACYDDDDNEDDQKDIVKDNDSDADVDVTVLQA